MNYTLPQSGIVRAGSNQRFFGAPIGVMLLDDVSPYIPGSVGNAGTFSQPVRYRTMPGVTGELVLGPDADKCESVVVETAMLLASEGARMITANCGYTARFQHAVSKSVDVPVLLSPLLMVPFLERMLPAGKNLGILTGDPATLTEEFLAATNLTEAFGRGRIVVGGLDDAPVFLAAYQDCVGEADVPAMTREVVGAAKALVDHGPDIGFLLLECSEFPPYAEAVQQATGVPVFDYTSLVEFFAGGLRRKSFDGFM